MCLSTLRAFLVKERGGGDAERDIGRSLWQPMKIVLAQRRLKHQCHTQAENQHSVPSPFGLTLQDKGWDLRQDHIWCNIRRWSALIAPQEGFFIDFDGL